MLERDVGVVDLLAYACGLASVVTHGHKRSAVVVDHKFPELERHVAQRVLVACDEVDEPVRACFFRKVVDAISAPQAGEIAIVVARAGEYLYRAALR